MICSAIIGRNLSSHRMNEVHGIWMRDRWNQIDDIYHRALQQNSSQRSAFLRNACAADETLRREVESLLRYRSEAEHLMEKPAMDVAAESLATGDRRLREGQHLSHYPMPSLPGSARLAQL